MFAHGKWQQVLGYGVVGGSALLLDSLVFFALTSVGLAVVPANLIARVAGAIIGFLLNGMFTFRGIEGRRLGRQRMIRYVVAWLGLTATSTLAVQLVAEGLGLQWAWLTKPLVDGLLAGVAFLISRSWIYR